MRTTKCSTANWMTHGLLTLGLATSLPFTAALAQTPVAPPSGLIYWWPGDGTAEDIAGNSVATPMNGATYAAGHVQQAFRFDGVDDYVETTLTGPMGKAARTIDAWIKPSRVRPTAIVESQAIVDYGDHRTTGGEFYFSVEWENGRPSGLGLRTQNARIIYDVPGLDDGAFHHVAVVVPFAGAKVSDVVFFKDGVAVPAAAQRLTSPSPDGGSINTSIVIDTKPNRSLRIGMFVAGVVPPAYYGFKGEIDEVQVFNAAVPPAGIASIASAGSAGKCKPPVWALNRLIATLAAMGLPPGSFNPLNNFLRQTLDRLNGGDKAGAINRLDQFIGLTPSKVAPAQAGELLQQANAIKAALQNCP